MTDRMKRTVRLGSLVDPAELFTQQPGPMQRRCRRAFASWRARSIEQLKKQGAFNGHVRPGVEPPPMPGMPGYEDNWNQWYELETVRTAQTRARTLLEQTHD